MKIVFGIPTSPSNVVKKTEANHATPKQMLVMILKQKTKMNEETADKIIDAILKVFEDSNIPIMERLTVFAKIQNIIYSEMS